MSTQPSKDQLRYQAIWARMANALHPIAQDLAATQRKQNLESVMLRYDLGVQLRQMEQDSATYGCRPIEKLARYLHLVPADLYAMRDVAAAMTREEVAAYAQSAQAHGAPIDWPIIASMLALPSRAHRLALVHRLNRQRVKKKMLNTIIQEVLDSDVSVISSVINTSADEGIVGGD